MYMERIAPAQPKSCTVRPVFIGIINGVTLGAAVWTMLGIGLLAAF